MKPRYLGTESLGFVNVDLFVDDELEGANFWFRPQTGGQSPRISVGLNTKWWSEVASCFLHEVFEFQYSHQDLRYVKDSKIDDDSANFYFIFDHTQFNETISRSTLFITKFLPVLAEEFKRVDTKRKLEQKRKAKKK